ncbi:MAG: bifunctional oligoribonuclease/PAP phosphatase NrnA [Gemmatimonadota bacterium]|nr:bifunctional oligoribonuclease/PAP phosphatase NrnA [Gemmatimonadota bacterium]MDE3217480.1 bifunctional oligoribonuclease/PAP phosphatase NrnA [Gemmatimonadota bacterium]
MTAPDPRSVAPARREAILRLAEFWRPGVVAVLSTHINADGDGCGSESALARLLAQRGMTVRIVNPTPWPDLFRFLLGDDVQDATAQGAEALLGADLLVVVDINDVTRLGTLAEEVRGLAVPHLVIDHHVPGREAAGDVVFADTAACATGELIYDLAHVLNLEITPDIARAIYTAILTDTGGFRFSNTSPRAHTIAADLMTRGVDPEEMYRRVYASSPVGRVRLLAEVLQSLGVDQSLGLSWLSMRAGALGEYGVKQEDLDGIVEHARSIAGTRLALFFRDLGHNKVKVSFRSTGAFDANQFARRFGGGGHARASGALIAGTLPEVRDRVLAEARADLGSLGKPPGAA